MKARIGTLLADRRGMCSAAAVERLQAGPVASETRATEFNTVGQHGHSDAG